MITAIQTLARTMKGYAGGARRITDLWIKRGGGGRVSEVNPPS